MTYGISINLKDFKKILYQKYPLNKELYSNILSSFSKRNSYCDVYYGHFKNATTEEKITDDFKWSKGIDSKDETDHRVYYESATLSYFQNIHALCDCASFAVNEIALTDNKIDKKIRSISTRTC